MPTTYEIEQKVMDAFYNEKKAKVTRRIDGEEETCLGKIYEVARREHPKTKRQTMCFSMVSEDKWWTNGTLQSLSPWVSQISEIEVL